MALAPASVLATDYQVLYATGDERLVRSPSWSPDGHWITFSILDEYGLGEIYIISSAGGVPERITSFGGIANNPVWSPDGEWIAFDLLHNYTQGQAVWRIRPSGLDPEQVVDTVESDVWPAWSPDARKIVFHTYWRLFVVSAEGGVPTQLLSAGSIISDPVYSPDGAWIVFTDRRMGELSQSVYRVPSTGGVPERLLASPRVRPLWEPAWSPDGSLIAFCVAAEYNTPYARHDVYLWRVGGNNLAVSQVTISPDYDREPSWSPDGQAIAYRTKHELVVARGFPYPENATAATPTTWGGLRSRYRQGKE